MKAVLKWLFNAQNFWWDGLKIFFKLIGGGVKKFLCGLGILIGAPPLIPFMLFFFLAWLFLGTTFITLKAIDWLIQKFHERHGVTTNEIGLPYLRSDSYGGFLYRTGSNLRFRLKTAITDLWDGLIGLIVFLISAPVYIPFFLIWGVVLFVQDCVTMVKQRISA